MTQKTYQSKMKAIKKMVFALYLSSLILGICVFVLFVVFNFAGVFSIQTLPGTKYQNGFTYPGWQAIFFGMGEMMVQGYTESSFNIVTCLAMFVPVLTLVVLQPMAITSFKKKGINQKKAIYEIIMAVVILIGAILLFNVDQLWIANAKATSELASGSYANYYKEYLVPAMNGEVSFAKTLYPTLLFIISLFAVLTKAAYGIVLLYQKNFAKKYKNKIVTIDEKDDMTTISE